MMIILSVIFYTYYHFSKVITAPESAICNFDAVIPFCIRGECVPKSTADNWKRTEFEKSN